MLQQKYLFVSSGRCGTTLLEKGLAELGVTGGEILNDPRWMDQELVTKHNITDRSQTIDNKDYIWSFLRKYDCGRLMYYTIPTLDLRQFEVPLIHIVRKDTIGMVFSFFLAMRNDRWHFDKDQEYGCDPIRIEYGEFDQQFWYYWHSRIRFEQEYNYIVTLSYESIIENWDATLKILSAVMNIGYKPVKPPLVKVLSKPLGRYISNYNELMERIKNSEIPSFTIARHEEEESKKCKS